MHDLVDINTAGIGKLAVIAVPTGVQQHPVVLINVQSLSALPQIHHLVLLGVEHVVALLAKPDAHKTRTFSGNLGHYLFSKLSANKELTLYISIRLYNI